ncbi:TIGR04283 family arsenosugar biosynthesis glycosyltransferase [Cryomorphaceae bacterium 1068]|nr:TIGR04283 family arsenosugar biosynthesis glycosyltransferase [Cryomorphaceae bacterium 1068]
MNQAQISIIIPVLNEASTIEKIVKFLFEVVLQEMVAEIILVDGGSTDGSLEMMRKIGGVVVVQSEKGRALQLNAGAAIAKGEILYFLHADSFPPKGFEQMIVQSKAESGCFRLRFDPANSLWLRLAPWFTKFDSFLFRGGDQSLFIEREVFESLGGFDERYKIYEDVEFINRIKRKHDFEILNDYVVTSSRRFQENGTMRLYFHFAVIHLKALMGKDPASLSVYYENHIK